MTRVGLLCRFFKTSDLALHCNFPVLFAISQLVIYIFSFSATVVTNIKLLGPVIWWVTLFRACAAASQGSFEYQWFTLHESTHQQSIAANHIQHRDVTDFLPHQEAICFCLFHLVMKLTIHLLIHHNGHSVACMCRQDFMRQMKTGTSCQWELCCCEDIDKMRLDCWWTTFHITLNSFGSSFDRDSVHWSTDKLQ